MTIDINAIREALPHRYPMLLVDRVLEVSEDEITAIKNVTINEPFFNGHFPQYPVMPGVLIMEALAQTAGVLELSKPENKGKLVFYAGMDKVSYAERVAAGYAGTAQDFSPSSPPGGLVRVEAIDGDSSEELNTAVLACV